MTGLKPLLDPSECPHVRYHVEPLMLCPTCTWRPTPTGTHCVTIDVDGEPVRIQTEAPLADADIDAIAQVVRASRQVAKDEASGTKQHDLIAALRRRAGLTNPKGTLK